MTEIWAGAGLSLPRDRAHFYHIPSGMHFAKALREGLLMRLTPHGPLSLAQTVIYANTKRTARGITMAFAQAGATLMPQIKVIADLAEDPRYTRGLPPLLPPLARKLMIAQLARRLSDKEAVLASEGAVVALSEGLIALLDRLAISSVSPQRLKEIDVGAHSAHWQRSLDILSIFDHFAPDDPLILGAEGRLNQAIAQFVAQIEAAPPSHPILIVGSTGSRPSTRALMRAVAGCADGAVVLPGLDLDLPEPSWRILREEQAGADHPQGRMARLLHEARLHATDVMPWLEKAEEPALVARRSLVSLALRPAPVTDEWIDEIGQTSGLLGPASAGLSLIEAAHPREEAEAVALAMRDALINNKHVALITPDRQLARQVTANLRRYGLVANDSAGLPLSELPAGRLLRLIIAFMGGSGPAAAPDVGVVDLIALLKHPLVLGPELALPLAAGKDQDHARRRAHLTATRRFESHYVRGRDLAPTPQTALASFLAQEQSPEAQLWGAWLSRLLGLFVQGRCEAEGEETPRGVSLLGWVRHLKALLGDVAPRFSPDESRAIEALLDDLETHATLSPTLSHESFAALVLSELSQQEIRQAYAHTPGLYIWGAGEARSQWVERVILAGLCEGVWPSLPGLDPWLNRDMCRQIGVSLPEEHIGLSAHDFQQAIAMPEVVLSYAMRNSEAPVLPSRWLNRLGYLMRGSDQNKVAEGEGKTAYEIMKARGHHWLALARQIDQPEASQPRAPRPAPNPKCREGVRALSVTQIRTLIRDPYAIYARQLLKLRPLNPLMPAHDPRIKGIVLHKLMEEVARADLDPADKGGVSAFMAYAREIVSAHIRQPQDRIALLTMLSEFAPRYLAWHDARVSTGQRILKVECRGGLVLSSPSFTLTGKADRIDLCADGTAVIYDCKSGSLPTAPQIKSFEKQLPLEALVLAQGGFEGIGRLQTRKLGYIAVKADARVDEHSFSAEETAQHFEELQRLMQHYLENGQAFHARARLFKVDDQSDYDHLSRYGEWAMSDAAQIIEVDHE